MESRRKKIQKTSQRNRRKKSTEKNQEKREIIVPWADLPQGILELILGKLQDAVDLIRFRAVCKNWHNTHIPKHTILEYINNRRNLPWLCNLRWAKDNSNRLECQLYDPNSAQIFTSSKKVYGCRYSSRFYSKQIEFLCSNKGWLIGYYHHYYALNKWEMFMYNPYSQHFIPLPFTGWQPCYATFSGDPVSENCRVFVFCRSPYKGYKGYITSYTVLNNEEEEDRNEWKVEFVDVKQEECCGIQYMNEQLFCLFEDGIMKRYSLADECWRQIVVAEGTHRLAGQDNRISLWLPNQPLWLAKGDGDLLVACELGLGLECSTFCFEFSNASWVGSDLQESRATVFIMVTQK